MLHKTFRRLAALNSVVFLVILLLFGAIVYGYIAYRLFDEMDASLRARAESFQVANNRVSFARMDPSLFDPRIFIILRDAQGAIYNLYPSQVDETGAITGLAQQVSTGHPQIRQMQGHTYRMLSLPYNHQEKKLSRGNSTFIIQDVVAISIVDSETALLRSLLIVIGTVSVFALVLTVMAGLYLARRAMSPIRLAWDKQQQFVADASHELRTPLAVVKSNAELILRHPDHTVQDESIRLTNIIREAIRMNRLVSTLLTLARADAKEAELTLIPTSLQTVAIAVREQFLPLAEMRGLELNIQAEDDLILLADKERLHQLLIILLDNALKYTSVGQVSMRYWHQAGNAVIEVSDTGYGILPNDLPHIFDRFFRVDKARSREEGGIGLGLSIAEWIAKKHGGKIRVTSEVGKGSCFRITLPLQR